MVSLETNLMETEQVPMLKLLLIGEAGVGKSTMLLQYTDGTFNHNSKSTIGVDIKSKIVNVDGRPFKIVIWDTAGQERYKTVIPSVYKGSQGIFLTYDITNKDTFLTLDHWLQECIYNCDLPKTIFYIIGNKIDLAGQNRKVTIEDLNGFSAKLEDYKKSFPDLNIRGLYEVSAKDSLQIKNIFESLISSIVSCHYYTDDVSSIQKNKHQQLINLLSFNSNSSSCC